MIKYSLVCENSHDFEGWFASGDDYETQRKRRLIACPGCGSHEVSKSLMAPGIPAKNNRKTSVPVAAMNNPVQKEMMNKLREIRKEIEKSAENVGEKFPEEARKIHYGEAEERGIYGKASVEDAAGLVEEGINVMPIPELPEDKN